MPEVTTNLRSSAAAWADLDPASPDDDPTIDQLLRSGSDAALLAACTAVVGVPREAAPDSFVLHAPLELAARARLLRHVPADARAAARRELLRVAVTYARTGPAAPTPAAAPHDDRATVDQVVDRLRHAATAGDLDAADAAAAWLESRLDGDALAGRLTDLVIPSLAGAAHGSILLNQLRTTAPADQPRPSGLRAIARELARQPTWTLSWHRQRPRHPRRPDPTAATGGVRAAEQLVEVLRAPDSPGDPGSSFIYPMMHLTESSGLAASSLTDVVDDVPLAEAGPALLRVASWSMLQDDPGAAPYGWTHCLTIPQAVLGLADRAGDPADAVALAATHTLGFRALLGRVRLDPTERPQADIGEDPLAALDGTPKEAAAGAWQLAGSGRPDRVAALVAALSTRAATHPDAHLVKYTVACLDAAATDPAAAPLHLAAAASLGAWWARHDDANEP